MTDCDTFADACVPVARARLVDCRSAVEGADAMTIGVGLLRVAIPVPVTVAVAVAVPDGVGRRGSALADCFGGRVCEGVIAGSAASVAVAVVVDVDASASASSTLCSLCRRRVLTCLGGAGRTVTATGTLTAGAW